MSIIPNPEWERITPSIPDEDIYEDDEEVIVEEEEEWD